MCTCRDHSHHSETALYPRHHRGDIFHRSTSQILYHISHSFSVPTIKAKSCADPEGGTGIPDPPPLENYKNIGFLSNTGPDPLKITKLPSQHSMLGHHRPISEAPFKWRFAGRILMALYMWYLDPFSPHQTKKKSCQSWTKLSGSVHAKSKPKIHVRFFQLLTCCVLSANNHCKLFGSRSGPTKHQACSGFKLFDILMDFLKEFLKKIILKKNQQMTK